MKTITAQWFECTVAFDKTEENGLTKKVSETYVVDAVSFTEAERRIVKEVAPFTQGVLEVKKITKASYREIAFMNDGEKILSNETEKLNRAMNVGKGAEQFDKPADFNPNNVDTHYYKMKVAFIELDEKTGKEKFSNVNMLVEACSLRDAMDNVDAVLQGSMTDYVSVNAVSTKIVDVFIHKSDKVDDDNRPLDVVLVTPENLKVALGRRLVHPILKHWEETFIDEDTKEEVKIDRSDVVFYRGDQVTPEMWAELIERKEHDVTLYR